MRRACLAFLAALLLTTACAAEQPLDEDGAAREVDALDAESVAETIVLRLALARGWSIDPADAGPASLANRVVAGLLYEGLTALDDDGLPVPALAQRWTVSDDRLTWTFELADGLTDGAGDPITADDVEASLERIAARGAADQAATALYAISGWNERLNGDSGGVTGISAPDETTLVIRLDSPYELLLEVLASPAFGITGEMANGDLRTTGAFRSVDEAGRFVAVDSDSPVSAIDLVVSDDGPVGAMAAGEADWAVLSPDDASTGLPADIIRQPLDIEVAIVARSPDRDTRLGLLGALLPLRLATSVDGLAARSSGDRLDQGTVPDAALVDVPQGALERLGQALVEQFEDAGITVLEVSSDADEFAARVAGGDALLFPVVVAGGTGESSALLRVADPGSSDDVFGPLSDARSELAGALVAEVDPDQRALFADALYQALRDEGLFLPIGQFEVLIALGQRLDGLRHRADGTLDLTRVGHADS